MSLRRIEDHSNIKYGASCEEVKRMKVVSYICKKSNFDIWQGSEYTSNSHGQTNTPQTVKFPIKDFSVNVIKSAEN